MMVEAKKLAFADREEYLADPEWVDVPIEGLLSKGYASERANMIDMSSAAIDVPGWRPMEMAGRQEGRAST